MNAPDNKALGASARAMADRAPAGSIDRRAYGCAAVALSTTRTIPAARKVLDSWDGAMPGITSLPGVRLAALGALDTVARLAGAG